MILILKIIWFILPAGAANISAALSAIALPRLNYPVDCNIRVCGKRLFGDNKTWRGLVGGVIAGGLIFILQRSLYTSSPLIQKISLFDYQNMHWFLGFLFGFGALFGDLVKSFMKRQMNIASGKSWFLFDQIDWIIGSLLFVYPFIELRASLIALTVILGILLHFLIKLAGYLVGVDKTPV